MPRRWWGALAFVVVVAAGAVAAVVVTGKQRDAAPPLPPVPGPESVVAAYLTAWGHGDWAGMAAHAAQPPANFAAMHQSVVTDLRVTAASYTPSGNPTVTGDQAIADFHAHLRLRGLGDWDYTNRLPLIRQAGAWLVSWSPQAIYPDLTSDRHFTRTRTVPPRGNILARDGTPLASDGAVVGIGIEPSHVKDRPTVLATLARVLGVDATAVNAALSAPGVRPDDFVPVQQVTAAAFVPLRPVLAPVPGIVFQHLTGRVTATPDLSAHVVGHMAQATAEQLGQLGDMYMPGDSSGQTGIEKAYESTLRGTPSGTVTMVDAAGATVAVAKQFAGTPSQAVTTTLDLGTQQAAEKALNGVVLPSAVVVVQPSSGDILAVVARPISGIDRALESVYPPGSTFKIVTSTALLASGVTANQATSCPPTVTVDGRSFKNFEGETFGSLPFHRAFAISCNTAFVQLADRLNASDLASAARQYGFGLPLAIGVPALGGSYPTPADAVEKVASAIGQGRVTASPLEMATVAAAVDAGVWHSPHLTGPPPPDPGVTSLPADIDQQLRALMAEVVTSGTGTAANVPGGVPVFGKTGTAEFGVANPPMTHAWFVGFRGDLAFSVLVEGGGVGGRVAAPIAARLLVNVAAIPAVPPGQPGQTG